MTLREQQSLFVQLIGLFVGWVYEQGYELTFSEAWRSPEEAAVQAAKGAGVACSLHTERLAIDLNLFKDGVLLSTADDYRPLGDQWKSMHPLARWGGDFTRVDADHFSLTYGGVS
jgi:hypothetical protein